MFWAVKQGAYVNVCMRANFFLQINVQYALLFNLPKVILLSNSSHHYFTNNTFH